MTLVSSKTVSRYFAKRKSREDDALFKQPANPIMPRNRRSHKEETMPGLLSDPRFQGRFQGRFAWEVTSEEYGTVCSTWLKHVGAEEKLFVPHPEEEEEQQLEIVRSTMTDDLVYEIKTTGERWEGWDGAVQFYKTFLAAFSGMQWVPQTVVIGPQGILDVADVTATQESPFGGIDQRLASSAAGVGRLLPLEPGAEEVRGRDVLLDPFALFVAGSFAARLVAAASSRGRPRS